MPEGDGTMLDHTLFLYGTGISDSNTHFHDDLPIALVGGKAAGIKGGRYVRYPKGTPLANLHVTLLDKLGVQVEKFGDSTGRLDRIVSVVEWTSNATVPKHIRRPKHDPFRGFVAVLRSRRCSQWAAPRAGAGEGP